MRKEHQNQGKDRTCCAFKTNNKFIFITTLTITSPSFKTLLFVATSQHQLTHNPFWILYVLLGPHIFLQNSKEISCNIIGHLLYVNTVILHALLWYSWSPENRPWCCTRLMLTRTPTVCLILNCYTRSHLTWRVQQCEARTDSTGIVQLSFYWCDGVAQR